MQNDLLKLLNKRKNVFLFFLLALIALYLTFQKYRFHKTYYLNSVAEINGGINELYTDLEVYTTLKKDYNHLLKENADLRKKLLKKKRKKISATNIKDSIYEQEFTVLSTQIVYNSVNKTHNSFVINSGIKDTIKRDLGVINDKGVLGIVANVSKNYAQVKSILNRDTYINARIRNIESLGTVSWDGTNHMFVQLEEIPKYTNVKIGDTIETNNNSTIFPEGILIGTVHSIEKDSKGRDSHLLQVKLFNDISTLRSGYIVKKINKIEIDSLINLR